MFSESPVHRGISEPTEQHQYETPHLGHTATLVWNCSLLYFIKVFEFFNLHMLDSLGTLHRLTALAESIHSLVHIQCHRNFPTSEKCKLAIKDWTFCVKSGPAAVSVHTCVSVHEEVLGMRLCQQAGLDAEQLQQEEPFQAFSSKNLNWGVYAHTANLPALFDTLYEQISVHTGHSTPVGVCVCVFVCVSPPPAAGF